MLALNMAACNEYGEALNSPAKSSAMTYNIRIISAEDNASGDGWEVRKKELTELVQRYDPDFLGLQEDLIPQQAFLKEKLSKDYGFAEGFMELTKALNTICYKKSDYRLVRTRQFWLSETPNSPSVGWDADQSRICVYGEFIHKASGKTIHVFNTHFDHRGAEARQASALLVVEKIKEFTRNDSTAAIIFMGDLNANKTSSSGRIVHNNLTTYLQDGLDTAPGGLEGPAGTFSGFNGDNIATNRIDFIYQRNLEVLHYLHIDDKRDNGRYPSDHLPVMMRFVY